MALHEKNLPFESRVINLASNEQYEPWFLLLNPKGEVPVLQDTGKIIPDSTRIIDYLEDNFSNGDTPRLIPMDQGAEIRQKVTHFRNIFDQIPARLLTVGSFVNTEFVTSPKLPFIAPALIISMLVGSQRNASRMLMDAAEKNPEAKETLMQKITWMELNSTKIFRKEDYVLILNQVEEVLDKVEEELKSHVGDKENWWLCTDRFTIADIDLGILLERLNQLGLESRYWKNGKRPLVEKYYSRMKQRESFKKTIPTLLVHVQLFIAFQKPVIIGISIVAAIAVIFGGFFLARTFGNTA